MFSAREENQITQYFNKHVPPGQDMFVVVSSQTFQSLYFYPSIGEVSLLGLTSIDEILYFRPWPEQHPYC